MVQWLERLPLDHEIKGSKHTITKFSLHSLKMFLHGQKCHNHIIMTTEFVFWLSFSDSL